MDWPKEIARMAFVKNALHEADTRKIWPYYLPELGATIDNIVKTEVILGEEIDRFYREFLLYANGWKGFYQYVDLFGLSDLIGGKKMQYALDLLDVIDEKYFLKKGFCRNDLMPIAATLIDKDIFLIGKRNSSIAGKVIWYAGEEIEIFENFNEYFLAMVDYNIDEVNDLKV
ncbi:SMI1/KNR4 family protein [Acinetobacter pittii]|uniref:SMI1/KNR4 family protein n=1 Tax=Acinetobacter pittii TaxID=48296 RepID=UPI000F89BF55|nr:SMI1/KNR4 family protein [Acinetobacter pittii]RSN92342.1 SMI1/KNR4 family protein [Acinetobacter pittii]